MVIKNYITKIKNVKVYIEFLIIDFLLGLKKIKLNPDSLLVIRLDAIGDYVLFRNFLEVIKKSEKYKHYKLTLCGNIIWKDLAETFDSSFVDKFIWINRNRFYRNPFYKFNILKEIRDAGFNTVIETAYTREILYGDSLVKVSRAAERIGCSGSLDKHAKWKRNLLSDKYYTRLVNVHEENLFEFNRNKDFLENVLNLKIQIKKPSLDITKIITHFNLPKRYVVLFPGSKDASKRWSADNFAAVAKMLIEKKQYKIVIPGGPGDHEISEKIISHLNPKDVIDLTGKNSILQLIKIIAGADLVISNDTVAAHIAAAVGTRFICISNGIFLGRFHPYPKEIFSDSYYAYPDIVEKNINNSEFLEQIRYNSEFDINLIDDSKVWSIVNKVLSINMKQTNR